MTKTIIFRVFAFLSILAILVAVCVVEDRLVVGTLKNVNEICREIEIAAEQNDGIVNGEVASLVDNLEYVWETKEGSLCYLANHKSMEQLGMEIVRLKTYIDEEEPIEFFVSLKMILHYVETFQHFMGANVHNIL